MMESQTYRLKIPHHGSRYNLNTELIEIMKPEICFISADGSEGHPSNALVSYLRDSGINVQSTNEEGDIQLIVEGMVRYRPMFK